MNKFRNKIICGDVSKTLKEFPSEFIDCVVTSPPYWALRDYGESVRSIFDGDSNCAHKWKRRTYQIGNKDKNQPFFTERNNINEQYKASMPTTDFCFRCGAWKGQLGLEPTFDLYIKHLCTIFDEIKRVLKQTGTCWVNIGDTYSATRWTGEGKGQPMNNFKDGHRDINPNKDSGLPDKNLCMIPFRFAIEMQNRGWILRNTIIWHKPNCMPSSAKDRFTVDFEYIFFFVKNKKYWFETQYDPLKDSSIDRLKHNFNRNKGDIQSAVKTPGIKKFQEKFLKNQVQGRNKRCVWSITTKCFKGAHFAVFPPQLVENPIMAGCPEFVCKKCGKARKKIYNTTTTYLPYKHPAGKQPGKIFSVNAPRWKSETNFIGYSDCGCHAGFRPGIVLDPFSGSGTTLAVAKSLGRNYLGIDLNPEYIKMAQRRIAKLDESKNI